MSPGISTGNYEVFLSCRGPDTRTHFVDCLYEFMRDAGIRVFTDDGQLSFGETLGETLKSTVDCAKIFMPILSKTYAHSAWCLTELDYAVNHWKPNLKGKKIIPVFYDVTPNDVRLKYSEDLEKHEKKFGTDQVQKWKKALQEVASMKGWKPEETSYTRTCKAIVEEVLEELRRKQADLIHHMVGKDDHVSAISELLDLESTELKFLTIHGMGGIGKTTIAKVIFSLFRDQFQGCSFLANVGESSQQPHGLKHLKQQLLRDTIGINKEEQLLADIAKIDDGEVMRRRFLGRKVLIVLDDVGQADQVERLVGKYTTWFGLGSRVIITTRSMVAPLRLRYKTRVYEMRAMRYDEAITLFSRHAFGMDYPPDDYHSLSHEIVRRVGGFPLTLEAMGSFLYRKNEYIWKSTTSKLKLMPRSQSDDVLKICYDALTYEEKQIFLDIACFFVGEEKTNPDYMWNACGYFPEQGIKSLERMSLVRILDGKRFSMHDVLRCLGRRIGRDHGQCASRVWLTEDEQGTLKDAKGMENAEALRICLDGSSGRLTLERGAFASTPNLRFLELNGANLAGDFNHLFQELRWFSWHSCPSDQEVLNLRMKNLVILDLSRSNITEHWIGWTEMKLMYNLKVLDVTGCEQLTVTPDLSGFLALERLILEDCKKLTRIHSSIGELKHLEHLNVKGCDSLQELPEELGSLLSLVQILAGGSSLHKLRTSLGNLTALSILEVTKGTISKLPRTIGGMWGLKRLSLHGCQRLKKLPDSLGHLKYLIELDLSDTGITRLPYSVGKLTKLENIKIESSLITELPPSIGNLKKLEELNARRCRGLRRIPYEIGELSSLRLLQLSHTSIEELPCLPESLSSLHVKSSSLYVPDLSRQNDLSDLVLFGESGSVDWVDKLMKLVNLKLGLPNLKCLPSGFASLSLLKSLYLTCDNLLSIPPLPPNISRLILTGLREDTVLPNLSNLKNLSLLELRECKLCELTGLKLPRQLKAVNIIKFDFLERLPDLSILKDLSFLEFHSLGKLNELKLPGRLKGLYVADCMCLEILPDLSHLKHLELLHLSNCGRLSDVPGLGELTSLRKLTIHHCDNLRSLGDLSKLRNLAYLELHDCQNLKDVQGLGSLSLKRVSIYSCHSLINLPQTTLRTSRVKAFMEYSICRDELKLSTKRKLPSQVKQKVKKRCP